MPPQNHNFIHKIYFKTKLIFSTIFIVKYMCKCLFSAKMKKINKKNSHKTFLDINGSTTVFCYSPKKVNLGESMY